jgi:hypothetical protein
MLESLDLYKQVSNKPAQPHQKLSIIGGKSVKYFEFGIAANLDQYSIRSHNHYTIMSSRISLWTGLIGIGATIALVQPIASAKTPIEIGETAKAITVLITEPGNVGSGVILQRQGDIYAVLTAAHVVKNNVNYKITTPDDRSYEVISSSYCSKYGTESR